MLGFLKNFVESYKAEKARIRARRRERSLQARPCLETMEQRIVPSGPPSGPPPPINNAGYYWTGNTSTASDTASNWDVYSAVLHKWIVSTVVPGSADVINFNDDTTNTYPMAFANCDISATGWSVAGTHLLPSFGLQINVSSVFWAGALTDEGGYIELKPSVAGTTMLNVNGALLWDGGKIESPNVQKWGVVDVYGGGSNYVGSSSSSSLCSANPELGLTTEMKVYGLSGSTTKIYMGNFASGFNFKMDDGASLDIGIDGVWYCSQNSHNDTSGGITLGNTGQIVPHIQMEAASLTSETGGQFIRDLQTRSTGDAPSATPIVVAATINILGNSTSSQSEFGSMSIGDSLAMDVTENVNTISIQNAGAIYLGNGSTLKISGSLTQQGNVDAVTECYYYGYNAGNNVEITGDAGGNSTGSYSSGLLRPDGFRDSR
jgi:hypothetical protein